MPNPLRAAERRLVGALCMVAWLATGCVDVRIEQVQTQRAPSVAGNPDDLAVILTRRQGVGDADETDFADCLGDKLDDELALYPQRGLRDLLFPWFEPRIAPRTLDDFQGLIKDAVVAKRLRETGVRYIIWVDGDTHTPDPLMMWPVGVSWEKSLSYDASVWDVKKKSSLGKVHIDAKGTSYLLVAIVPLPLIARTDASACSALAAQLAELLPGEQGETRPR